MSAEFLPSPSRTMADIAALFLSNARNNTNPSKPAPARQPPQAKPQAAAPAPSLEPAIIKPNGIAAANSQSTQSPQTAAAAFPDVGSFAGDLSDLDAWPRFQFVLASFPSLAGTLDALREWLSGFAGNVGLIVLDRGAISLYRLEHEDADTWDHLRTFRGPPEVQLAGTLREVSEALTHWLIVPATLEDVLSNAVLPSIADALLICEPHSDAVIAAYRQVKGFLGAHADWSGKIRLMVTSTLDVERADTVSRLQQVISEFLSRTVQALPTSRAGVALLQPIMELPIRTLDDAQRTALGGAITRFISETLADDGSDLPLGEIDDEESVALQEMTVDKRTTRGNASAAPQVATAQVDNDVHAIAPAQTASVEPVAPVTPAASTPESPAPVDFSGNPAATPVAPAACSTAQHAAVASTAASQEPPLCVLDIPPTADDAAAWQILRDALPMLSTGGTGIAAKPPLDIPAALLIDPAGRLHAWVQVRQDDVIGWGVIWHWAEEFHAVVASVPAFKVDPTLSVRMHVLLPRTVPANLRLPPALKAITFYRLRTVRWGAKVGAALLPIG